MSLKNIKAGRLKFTTSLAEVLNEQQIVFSAVGTPPDEDGSADLKYVYQVAETIGEHLNKYVVVVNKEYSSCWNFNASKTHYPTKS